MNSNRVIIDASAILAVLLKEEDAISVLQKTRGYSLYSAKCLPFEIGNSLSKQLKRKLISVENVQKIFSLFEKLTINLLDVDFRNALSYCAEENHYAYDMYYLDCAIKNKYPLLTLDKKLSEIALKRGVICL